MRILITGGTGATGHYLTEYLKGDPLDEVLPVGSDAFDFSNQLEAFSMVGNLRPDWVFHLAARTKVRESFERGPEYVRQNVSMTMNVLEAARRYAPRARILVASSCEVYGAQPGTLLETSPFNPANPYALSKVMCDEAARYYAYQHGLHVVRTRLFNVINPRATHLFSTQWADQVVDIERGLKSELLHGDLDGARCLMDVRDVVRCYVDALAKGKPGEAYNVGTTVEVPLRAFMRELISNATTSRKIVPQDNPELHRPRDIYHQVPDTNKFDRDVGTKPLYDLEHSISWLLDERRKLHG